MSDYDHPGGGFSSVDGYNDLAGSQAEEQRRMQEDEMNRQHLEQQANDAAAVQAEQQAAYEQQNRQTAQGASHRERSKQQPKNRPAKSKKSRPAPAAQPGPVNPFFALLGFIAAGFWGLGLVEGDGRLFGAAVAGLVGAYIAGHYHKVLIAASLVGAGWWFLNHFDRSKSQPVAIADTAPAVATTESIDAVPPSRAVQAVVAKSEPQTPTPQTPEQEVESRYPYPAKPEILLRPHQPLATDATRMRDFQQKIFDFEKRTGKSFLTDHRSMKPATKTHFDYFSRYDGDGLMEGQETIADLQPIQGVWDYRSPQLWELDLSATVDQMFTFTTTNADGTTRSGVMRFYSGDGLCYQPMLRPLLRRGRQHEVFQTPVRGGDVWRDFVRAVYHAKTDAELLALDPMNLAIKKTYEKIALAQKNYESQKRLVDGFREASLPFARSAWKLRSSPH